VVCLQYFGALTDPRAAILSPTVTVTRVAEVFKLAIPCPRLPGWSLSQFPPYPILVCRLPRGLPTTIRKALAATDLDRANISLWVDGRLPDRRSKTHLRIVPLTAQEQLHHLIARVVLTTMAPETHPTLNATTSRPGLRKVEPYWYPYTTMAKLRWQNRELLEVVSTEFRDRSMEYYVRLARCFYLSSLKQSQRYALESGVTTVNGKIAAPETIIKNGDRIEYVLERGAANFELMLHRNIVHRHEPPVTSTPIKILHHDAEREFIVVDKPGSIVRSSILQSLCRLTVIPTAYSRNGEIPSEHPHRNPTEGIWFQDIS
jgi:hypothetical protein